MNMSKPPVTLRMTLGGICLALALVAGTGCQIESGGQILPSAYYHKDDVQYFGAGPEMKLSREAAAQKAYSAEEALRGR